MLMRLCVCVCAIQRKQALVCASWFVFSVDMDFTAYHIPTNNAGYKQEQNLTGSFDTYRLCTETVGVCQDITASLKYSTKLS
eukprot:m.6134 g.6134  ORF g.6134 m.6134 type:complete len:82 (+) comp5130_c0_seq2:910-1155(+)